MKEALELHSAYCQASGQQIAMQFGRDRAWSNFIQAGFTKADLVLVISFLKRGIKKGERNPGCLRFRNLVEQLDYFEEELAMARSALKIRPRQADPEPSPRVVQLEDGHSVTVLDPSPSKPEPDVAETTRAAFLGEIARFKESQKQPSP